MTNYAANTWITGDTIDAGKMTHLEAGVTSHTHAAGDVAAGDGFQRIGIPTYIYPGTAGSQGDYWARALQYCPIVDIVIADPATGPGTTTDANYTAQIATAKACGATVLGYSTSSYAAKNAATMTAEIGAWLALYPDIDGMFFDQADTTTANLALYQTMYATVKDTFPANGRRLVVNNPGGPVSDENFMLYSDIVVSYEGDPTSYRSRVPSAWEVNYPANRWWHLIYGIASLAERDEMLKLTRTNRAGYIYLTDDVLSPNPYDTIPNDPFWAGEVAAVAAGPAALGYTMADNGLSPLRIRGRKTTTGAPGSGTWAVGDAVIDSAGAWHLCTAAGTPGTWT